VGPALFSFPSPPAPFSSYNGPVTPGSDLVPTRCVLAFSFRRSLFFFPALALFRRSPPRCPSKYGPGAYTLAVSHLCTLGSFQTFYFSAPISPLGHAPLKNFGPSFPLSPSRSFFHQKAPFTHFFFCAFLRLFVPSVPPFWI